MKTDIKRPISPTGLGFISRFQDWLISAAIAIFALASLLKFTAPVLKKLGLMDTALAISLPESLRIVAAVLEAALVVFLMSKRISKQAKLSALLVSAIVLIAFRLLAFGTILPPDCGCFGPLKSLNEALGRAFETVASFFVLLLPLGYLLQLVDRKQTSNE